MNLDYKRAKIATKCHLKFYTQSKNWKFDKIFFDFEDIAIFLELKSLQLFLMKIINLIKTSLSLCFSRILWQLVYILEYIIGSWYKSSLMLNVFPDMYFS